MIKEPPIKDTQSRLADLKKLHSINEKKLQNKKVQKNKIKESRDKLNAYLKM